MAIKGSPNAPSRPPLGAPLLCSTVQSGALLPPMRLFAYCLSSPCSLYAQQADGMHCRIHHLTPCRSLTHKRPSIKLGIYKGGPRKPGIYL